MKTLIFSFVLCITFKTYAGITMIADLDDTIKIINSGNYATISFNALLRNRVFTGMPELLRESREYSDKFYVVSASPAFIRKKVVNSLNKFDISYDEVLLKSFRGLLESKHSFKLRSIQEIIEATEDDIILLGDDVSHDPAVYDELVKLYPHRILASYIHVIKGRPLPDSAIPHFTSFDVAVLEYEAGRMKQDSVMRIFEILMEEKKLQRIIPGFALCPQDESPWKSLENSAFSEEASQISEKIVNYCRN